MKIAMHQPDFLPYTGFFYKILKSDTFDYAIHDQFVKDGYQRRVKFNDRWVNVAIIDRKKLPQKIQIKEVLVDTAKTKENILKAMEIEYRKEPYYKQVREKLDLALSDLCFNKTLPLDVYNMQLVNFVLEYLGVKNKTNLMVSSKPTQPKSFGIIEIMKKHYPDHDTYLSGTGGKAYTGNEFEENGLKIEYSDHKVTHTDSIIGALVRYENPLDVILLEE